MATITKKTAYDRSMNGAPYGDTIALVYRMQTNASGVLTGGDLLVLDVDTKRGKPGLASLAALDLYASGVHHASNWTPPGVVPAALLKRWLLENE
mgnify:CR=1 FL=1